MKNNFDLKKYLKEGRLYEEEMSSFPPFRDERPSETIMLAVDKAYYDDNGKVISWTMRPVEVEGKSIQDLRKTLEQMLECLDKEVIDDQVE